MYNIRRWWQRA